MEQGVQEGDRVAGGRMERGGEERRDRRAETRNRRQDCYSTLPPGAAGERSSVKPLIMPKQYTVGAPVSVADPRCSRLVPSKFRASNEFELESASAKLTPFPILRHRKLPLGLTAQFFSIHRIENGRRRKPSRDDR